MAGAKGEGTVVYFDVDADDEYEVVSCVFNVTPSGYTRDVITEELCLDEDAGFDDTGTLKYTPMSGLILFDNTAMDTAIKDAIEADTLIKAAVKINLTTPAYFLMSCKFTQLEFESIVRDQRTRYAFTLIPRTAPTRTTSAPTLEA